MELFLLRVEGLTFLSVQVSELAENAADRTKRVAACEFLRAFPLCVVGEAPVPTPAPPLMAPPPPRSSLLHDRS